MSLKKELINKIVTVTSKAAIACHKFVGKNEKKNADKAATDVMRQQLNKLDTKKIEPLSSIVDKTLEPRIDKINDGKIKDDILKNSPEKNEDFFIVPKVVE